MASSYWDKTFPVSVPRVLKTTRNLFYDRYPYRIEFVVVGIYRNGYGDLSVLRHHYLTKPYTESFSRVLSAVFKEKTPEKKLRMDGRHVQIFTQDEDTMIGIVQSIVDVVGVADVSTCLRSLYLPDASDPPKQGVRRTKNPHRYRYSVRVRGTRAVRGKQLEIERYIRNLGEEHISMGSANSNGSRTIFCNDVAQLDFLQLICPGCLGKIYELVSDQT